MSNLNFDATQVDPSVPFEPITAGDYIVAISDSEMRPNKSGIGEHLALEFVVLRGEQANKKLWYTLNLRNQSTKAVEIARANLSAICHAVDVMKPRDSSELHNKPMQVKVVVKKMDDGSFRNEVKGFKKRDRGAQSPALAPLPPKTEQVTPVAPVADPAPWSGGDVPF